VLEALRLITKRKTVAKVAVEIRED